MPQSVLITLRSPDLTAQVIPAITATRVIGLPTTGTTARRSGLHIHILASFAIVSSSHAERGGIFLFEILSPLPRGFSLVEHVPVLDKTGFGRRKPYRSSSVGT